MGFNERSNKKSSADASVIYVPPRFAANAIIEAADAFNKLKAKE